MKKGGHVISHRSFQEYFTAFCMPYLEPDKFMLLAKKFSKRVNDQVILLLADMSPEILRRSFILPSANIFEEKLQIKSKSPSVLTFFKHSELIFNIKFFDQVRNTSKKIRRTTFRNMHIFYQGESDFFDFASLLFRLQKSPPFMATEKRSDVSQKAIQAIFDGLGIPKDGWLSIIYHDSGLGFIIRDKQASPSELATFTESQIIKRPDLESFFKSTIVHDYLSTYIETAIKYVRIQRDLETSASTTLDALFDD